MEKEKAIVKFNGGNLAMLCSGCRVIIKTGKDFTQDELDFVMIKGKHLDSLYCEKCTTFEKNIKSGSSNS